MPFIFAAVYFLFFLAANLVKDFICNRGIDLIFLSAYFYLKLNCTCTIFSEKIVLNSGLLRLPFENSPLFIFKSSNDNQEMLRYSRQ